MNRLALSLLVPLLVAACGRRGAEAAGHGFSEELTWEEVRDLIASGKKAVIIATAVRNRRDRTW